MIAPGVILIVFVGRIPRVVYICRGYAGRFSLRTMNIDRLLISDEIADFFPGDDAKVFRVIRHMIAQRKSRSKRAAVCARRCRTQLEVRRCAGAERAVPLYVDALHGDGGAGDSAYEHVGPEYVRIVAAAAR